MAVTVDDIKELMATSDTADLKLHLETAELIVVEELSNKDMSAGRLDKITLFLGAHFATLALERGGLSRKTVGESTEGYHLLSPADRGYMSTRFGQQAIALDTSGTLAAQAQGALKAEFRVV